MITKYEIHIETKYTLFELLKAIQSKGMGVDFKMKSGDSGELVVMMPSDPKMYCFDLKLYKHDGDRFTYELGSRYRECLAHMEEIANILN